jgi:dethiobiotin synthetase
MALFMGLVAPLHVFTVFIKMRCKVAKCIEMRRLPKDIFVTGIDTNVGKTMVSAILAQALHADYWKPIQTGNEEGTDSITAKKLVSNPKSRIHPEAYNFKTPSVPVHAAQMEGAEIDPARINLPQTPNRLIVEGAGGLMVHLRKDFLMIDLIKQLKIPVMIVSKNYLGSINHTLLSIEALQNRGIEILGVIYNGTRTAHMRELIHETAGIPEIGSVRTAETVDRQFIDTQSLELYSSLKKHFAIV